MMESRACEVHSECLTGDVFGSLRCDCGEQLAEAMKRISLQAGEYSSICDRKEGNWFYQ